MKSGQGSKGKNRGGMNSGSQRRILKELSDLVSHPPSPRFKVFPNSDDLFFWKALIIGPPGSSYNYGVYLISINFPRDYPFKPPKIRYITPIYHCNVNSSGNVCIDILRD